MKRVFIALMFLAAGAAFADVSMTNWDIYGVTLLNGSTYKKCTHFVGQKSDKGGFRDGEEKAFY